MNFTVALTTPVMFDNIGYGTYCEPIPLVLAQRNKADISSSGIHGLLYTRIHLRRFPPSRT